MNTKRIGRLATVAASAALALQLFAGASAAAVPNGTSSGDVLGEVGGDGYAGFTSAFRFQDNNLAKLYFEADITNGASLPIFEATRNGNPVNCGASASVIKCEFKNVKNGETFAITFAIKPATAADVVATGGWSSTGYVVGGNNSHGDAWGIGGKDAAGNQRLSLTATYNADGDYAAGFGNSTLSTQTSGNKQSAKLTGLPAGKWAAVDDNAGSDGFGFSVITLNVNGGAAEDFNLVITYPKNTQAPKSYLHISDGYTNTEYFLCGRGQTVNCFTWDKKTSTATLFLAHNGSLRRTS